MMRRLLLLLLAAAGSLALGACQSTSAPDKPGSAFIAPQGRQGALIHRDSDFSFPATLAGFHRVRHVQYTENGQDVSVGYNHDDPRVVATVYVYPRNGQSVEQELARRMAEVQAKHPGARLISNTTASVTPGHVRALSAEYRYQGPFGGETQSLRSRLIVAEHKQWFVVYRFYYASPTQAAAEPLTSALATDFAWP